MKLAVIKIKGNSLQAVYNGHIKNQKYWLLLTGGRCTEINYDAKVQNGGRAVIGSWSLFVGDR